MKTKHKLKYLEIAVKVQKNMLQRGLCPGKQILTIGEIFNRLKAIK